jgi:hypothetical protein
MSLELKAERRLSNRIKVNVGISPGMSLAECH